LRQFLDGFLAGLEAPDDAWRRADAPEQAATGPVRPREPSPEPKPSVRVELEPHRAPPPEVVAAPKAEPPTASADVDRAIGVLKLSGWSVGDLSGRGADSGLAFVDPVRKGNDPAPAAAPPSSIAWTQVYEQARSVGMVDLS